MHRIGCLFGGAMLVLVAGMGVGAVPDDVSFPAPSRSGGGSLYAALQGRVDSEHFEARLLHWEVVGNLLWAGSGVNQVHYGWRTVPLLGATFPVQVFVLGEEGVWVYDPIGHRLRGLASGDLRALVQVPSRPVDVMRMVDGTPS
ncbi:MAG: hypothetical protein ACNA71_04960, partial [Kiritimatiellia bacterium]